MKIGDYVVRKSHDRDLTFEIIGEKEVNGETHFILSGLSIRILADAAKDDLELAREDDDINEIFDKKVKKKIDSLMEMRGEAVITPITAEEFQRAKKKRKKNKKKSNKKDELTFGRPGKVLHIDGDSRYLENCLKLYRKLGILADGRIVKEHRQPEVVLDLVKEIKPDIIVITGHDGMNKNPSDYRNLDNYRNSKYFVECVKILRDYEPSYDNLVIFAGACQSCYEEILDAGANFASSPNRILIHCLDPVFVCERVAYTRFKDSVNIKELVENTITGCTGVGGIETKGKFREGYPKSPYF